VAGAAPRRREAARSSARRASRAARLPGRQLTSTVDTTARKRSDLGRMARGRTINMAGARICRALGLVLSVVLARGLGVDDAGIFFEVVALYNILEVVGQAGAPSRPVRMSARHPRA